MFVGGGLPWEVPSAPLPPLGGLLSMLEGKDGVRASLLLSPPPVPRTAACVVLSQPNLAPTSTLPLSSRNTPSAAHASCNKALSSPAPPPLKFGVDRLLAAEPRKEPAGSSPGASHLLSCPPLNPSGGTGLSGTTCVGLTSSLGNTTCPVLTLAPSNNGPSSTTCPSLTSSIASFTCPVMPSCITSGAGGGGGLGCGCDIPGAGGKCPAECGGGSYYYTTPLYHAHPPHLLPYTSLYGGGVGGGRHEVLGVGVAGSPGRRKRTWTRAVFSNLQRKGLEKRFQLQKYITKPDRRQLAATLGLTDAQVKVWFQNRRMKWRHAELKKREQLQQQKPDPGSLHDQHQQRQQHQQEEDDDDEDLIGGPEMECMGTPEEDDEDDDELDPVGQPAEGDEGPGDAAVDVI